MIKLIKFITITIILVCTVTTCKKSIKTQTASPALNLPNILLIVADDMGQEIGSYGDSVAQTPHLDAFANENIRFDNAYVTQASCSPSRSSILTGLYPHQNGQTGLSHRGIRMHREFPNIVTYLREAGYTTGILGKLHVEPHSAFPFDYLMGGFDYESPGLRKNGKPHDDVAVVTTLGKEMIQNIVFPQRVDLMADSAATFIQRSGNKPFFLMANFLDPHSPHYSQVSNYPPKPLDSTAMRQLPYFPEYVKKSTIAGYYNGCSRMDVGFQMIIDKLKASGKYDQTMIIFIGDHGAPLPRAKTYIYEAGLRIPFMVRFPEKNLQVEEQRLVSTIDILPTILKQTGLEIPEDLPGRPLQDIVFSEAKDWRTSIAAEFNRHVPDYNFPQRSLITDKHKLIISPFAHLYNQLVPHDFDGDYGYIPGAKKQNMKRKYGQYAQVPAVEFYDLQRDPNEFNNLAEETTYEEIKNRMMSDLREWQRQTDDPLLDDKACAALEEEIIGLVNTYFELDDNTQ